MNIVWANSYEEGTTLLCVWSTVDKIKASALLTTLDPPQRYKKRHRRRSSTSSRQGWRLIIEATHGDNKGIYELSAATQSYRFTQGSPMIRISPEEIPNSSVETKNSPPRREMKLRKNQMKLRKNQIISPKFFSFLSRDVNEFIVYEWTTSWQRSFMRRKTLKSSEESFLMTELEREISRRRARKA